jgi:hypothetical protein
MAFKFAAKNRETGRTGAVTVKAADEQSARQKLVLGGYDVVRLIRVSNGQESSLQFHFKHSAAVSTPAPEKTGLVAALRSLVTRIDNAFYYAYY